MVWYRSALVVTVCAAAAMVSQGSIRAAEKNVVDLLKVGSKAADIELQPLEGDEKVKLSDLTAKGPVVLVVLRGWPGYQCPICFRQMGELKKHAEDFQELGATVVVVYPGPAEELSQHAKDFLKGTELPEPFLYVVDPDYVFTDLYQLRWDEPRETAYPSTFVLDEDRVIRFRKISTSHGDRARADDVVQAVKDVKAGG